MSLAAVLPLLLPAAVVLLPLGVALRDGQPAPPPLALRLGLAIGLGLGLGSCAYFLALLLFDGGVAGMVALDAAFVAALIALCRAARGVAGRWPRAGGSWSAIDLGLLAACALCAAAFLGLFAAEVYARPHGEIDAWLSWNIKARFLAAGGTRWRLPFADFFGHPDYPLLLPCAVARGWRYAGRVDQAMPIAIAALFAAACVGLLFGALRGLRGRGPALLAALCLLAVPGFARRAAWLYGDVPLAYYMLASLVLLAYWQRAPSRSAALLWAGLAGGFAAWTKREGLLFLLVLAIASCWSARGAQRWRVLGLLMLGAAGPLALRVYQSMYLAAKDSLTGRSTGELLARVSDPRRYLEIAAAVWRLLAGSPSRWLIVALPVFALAMGGTRHSAARTAARRVAAVVALLATLYAAIYVTTPAPLDWHLRTSLDRLLFHLWPSAIFALFLWAASPDERAAATPRRPGNGRGGWL